MEGKELLDEGHGTFVTVMTFTLPQDAAISRALLESYGIECVLVDEYTAQINNFYSNAIGGVKLQVRRDDYGSASEILYHRDRQETPIHNGGDGYLEFLSRIEALLLPFLRFIASRSRYIFWALLLIMLLLLVAYLN
jgi:hypothetical protein